LLDHDGSAHAADFWYRFFMKIRRMTVSNLRALPALDWTPPNPSLSGWHVILGDNGAGKSSFLRSMALVLVGPREAIAARQEWGEWLAPGAEEARIILHILRETPFDTVSGAGRIGDRRTLYAGVDIARNQETVEVQKLRFLGGAISADRHIWGTGHGWFSAAYGPFRRFSGGDKDAERIFLSNPKLGAHISVFGESVALTESLLWLKELHYRRLEHHPDGGLLNRLKIFINQPDFLPHDIKFKEVTSGGVEFQDSQGRTIHIENLSDGYRSILSMTFELIRQLCRVFNVGSVFSPDNETVAAPGVVLIDEIDAHLHPLWQKRVGFWFVKHFPNIQFIVTTHSPLVCQAASTGSIFRLASPGSDEKSQMLTGKEFDRLVYGDILEAYSTSAFGTVETRSEQSAEKQERLAILNSKELFKGLSADEKAEQESLRSIFAKAPHSTEREVQHA